MPYSVNLIKLLDKVDQPIREVLLEILAEIERQRRQWEESVTKTEFNELKEIVKELAKAQKETKQNIKELSEAQKKTEQRLDRLEKVVNELAEAQKKTEQRVNELAEAQKKTEKRVDRLEKAVNELIEAQKKTEQRVNELAEAQKKTEQRLDELAEAQKKTEEELKKLIGEHRKTREMLGGLAHTVGYVLEDRAYRSLPHLIKKDFGVEVEELKRDFIEIGPNKYEEVNIIGKGRRNGDHVWIIGDCKTQFKKRDVDNFLKRVSKIEDVLSGDKLLIAVTYQTSPQVQRYLKEKGIKLYFSYQFNRAD